MQEPKFGQALPWPRLVDKAGNRLVPGTSWCRPEHNDRLAIGYLWRVVAPVDDLAGQPLRATCLTVPGSLVDLDQATAYALQRINLSRQFFTFEQWPYWFSLFEQNGIWLANIDDPQTDSVHLRGYCPYLEREKGTGCCTIRVTKNQLRHLGQRGEAEILTRLLHQMVAGGARPY
jgi:hypothetical protein